MIFHISLGKILGIGTIFKWPKRNFDCTENIDHFELRFNPHNKTHCACPTGNSKNTVQIIVTLLQNSATDNFTRVKATK